MSRHNKRRRGDPEQRRPTITQVMVMCFALDWFEREELAEWLTALVEDERRQYEMENI